MKTKPIYLLVIGLLFITLSINAQTTTIGGVINAYSPVVAIDTVPCLNKVAVTTGSNFAVGDTVLIIQMKGANFDSTNSSTFGSVVNINRAGNYEIARVTAISTNTITLNGKLVNYYDVSGFVQLVRARNYINANVSSLLTCSPWNGQIGGVLVFNVVNTLSLGNDIDVTGKGFRPGIISNNPDGGCGAGSPGYYYPLTQSSTSSWSSGGAEKGEGIGVLSPSKLAGRGPLVNGGGGGNKHNHGGGGGSNFTSGGLGGNSLVGCNQTNGGVGGVDLSSFYNSNKFFMGGGGGRGDDNNGVGSNGEYGGGIIIISAGTINGNSRKMAANGNSVSVVAYGIADGAGGGGAGGVIFLKTNSIAGTFTAMANGGTGGMQNPTYGCVGPGGGGGTGAILTSLSNLSTITTSLLPGGPGIVIAASLPCSNTSYGALAGASNTVGPLFNRNLIYTPNNVVNTLSITASTQTACPGVSITLTGSGAQSYTWLPGNVSSGSIVVTPTVTTNYTLLGSTGNCSTTAVKTITVIPEPVIGISSSTPGVCNGFSAALTVTGSLNYTWYPQNTGGSSVAVTPSTSSFYTVIATSASGCTSNATFFQVVYQNPTITVSPPVSTICAGSTLWLSASGAQNYTWQPGPVTGNTFSVSPATASIYTVTGTDIHGCLSSKTASVYLFSQPTVSFAYAPPTCSALSTVTAQVSGSSGPYSYSWSPGAQTGPVATNLVQGNYSLTVISTTASCPTVFTLNLVPVFLMTGTVQSTYSLNCPGATGGTAAISVSGSSGNHLYSWTGPNTQQSTPTASALPGGVFTVVVTDALTNCVVTKTFQIVQPLPLNIIYTPPSPTVCLGGSITITANGSGGTAPYTFSWSTSAAGNSISVYQPTAGTYIYSTQLVDANNCSFTKTVAAVFVPNPTVSVVSNTFCPFSNGTLQALGATSYTWSSGAQGGNLVVSPPSTTSYSVIGSALGCTATASGTLTMLSAPQASAISNSPLCNGDSLKLFASGGVNYQWIGPSGFTSTLSNPALIVSNGMTGNFTVKVNGVNSCTSPAVINVLVYPTPTVATSGATVCEGSNAVVSAISGAGSVYNWSGPGTFSSALQSPTLTNVQAGNAGVYHVTVTSATQCTNTAVCNVSVVSKPSPTVVSNSPVCYGSNLYLSGSGGSAYLWSSPLSGTFSSFHNATVTNITSGGVFTLSVMFGPCVVDTSFQVLVNALPVPLISNNSPQCEGKAVVIGVSGGASYNWQGPGGYSSNQSTITIGAATASNAGTYSVTVTGSNTCVKGATTAVMILANPVVITKGDTTCIGNTAVISGSGGVSYSWTGPLGFTSTLQTISFAPVTATSAGIYTVAVTGSNTCVTTKTVSLVSNAFQLPVVTINAPAKACFNSVVRFTGSGGTAGEKYTWTGPLGFSASVQSPSLFINAPGYAGIYTLSIINANHCIASASFAIEAYPQPTGSLSADNNNLCVPFCTQVKFTEGQNIAPIVQTSLTVDNRIVTGNTASVCYNKSGSYFVLATFRDTNNCSNNASTNINAYPKPVANFYYTPDEPYAKDKIKFINSSSSGSGETFYWYFNGNEGADSVLITNPEWFFEEPGKYPVVLVVQNAFGCLDTVIKVVEVVDEFQLFVPNTFSPNADQLNDVFQPKGIGVRDYHLEVFDRWGELLFESVDFIQGWDGTYKGSGCQMDSYVWKIKLTDNRGKQRSFVGNVNLIR